jgi:hypothetical protein
LSEPPVVSFDPGKRILTIEDRPITIPKGRITVVCRFLWERCVKGEPAFTDLPEAVDVLQIWADSLRRTDNRFATLNHLPITADAAYLSKALYEMRTLLTEKGIGSAIPYLAPKSSSIGFTVRLP